METIDLSKLSPREKLDMLEKLKAEEKQYQIDTNRAYEGLKSEFLKNVMHRAETQEEEVSRFFAYIQSETDTFIQIMKDYAKVKKNGQQRSFSVVDENFKLEVRHSKVKRFDERADAAAERLTQFLQEWIKGKEAGTDDPMYQIAMLSITKTRGGEFDTKRISTLYQVEEKFNSPEYSEIMQLFRLSHTVDSTVTHYYFYKKDEAGVWQRVELSFNKL